MQYIIYQSKSVSSLMKPKKHLAYTTATNCRIGNAVYTVPSTYLLLVWRYYLFSGWWGIQSLLSWTDSVCAAIEMICTVKWCDIISKHQWKWVFSQVTAMLCVRVHFTKTWQLFFTIKWVKSKINVNVIKWCICSVLYQRALTALLFLISSKTLISYCNYTKCKIKSLELSV